MKKNVLITGGMGFVGGGLTEFLDPEEFNILYLNRGDNLIQILKNIDLIVHLAGKAHDKNAKWEDFKTNNVDLTREILEAARTSAPNAKIIFFSSAKVYGEISIHPFTETDELYPTSEYGKSKKLAEDLIVNSNFEYIIFRPCLIYSTDAKGNLAFLRKISKYGIPFPSNINNQRSLTSLEYSITQIYKALKDELEWNQKYNLSENIFSTTEIFRLGGVKFFLPYPKFVLGLMPKKIKQKILMDLVIDNKKIAGNQKPTLNKLKILIVTQYFWPESFKINDLAVELQNRGHEVTVYTGLPNYPQGSFFEGYSLSDGPYIEDYHGVKIVRSPLFPRGKGLGVRLFINYISFLLFSTILAPFRIRGKYDKIFIYQLSPVFAAIPAVFLRLLKRAPSILWVTDLWPDSLDATGVVKNKFLLSFVGVFVKLIYKFSDQIYISSRGFKDKILSMGVKAEKIKFWPQWAESIFNHYDASADTYSDPNLPKDGFIVMFAGNIGTAQDMPTLIQAADLLREHSHIHFVILGDGVMRGWTEEEVAKRKLESTFHMLGRKPIETMPYYYSKAGALLVSLIKRELFTITLPSKVQTYLASGKPLLASLDGEGAELILSEKAGLAAPATSPEILAERILEFSRLSKSELEQMGKNAYDCYQNQFERENLISILEVDFNKLKY